MLWHLTKAFPTRHDLWHWLSANFTSYRASVAPLYHKDERLERHKSTIFAVWTNAVRSAADLYICSPSRGRYYAASALQNIIPIMLYGWNRGCIKKKTGGIYPHELSRRASTRCRSLCFHLTCYLQKPVGCSFTMTISLVPKQSIHTTTTRPPFDPKW